MPKTLHFTVRILILLLQAPLFGHGVSADDVKEGIAPQVCEPCEGPYENVAVLIGADLSFKNAAFQAIRKDFPHFPQSIRVVIPDPIESPDHLRSEMIRIGRKCRKIKFLGLLGHGRAGLISTSGVDPRIQTPDHFISVANISRTFGGLDCVMAENADVLLASCEAGKGCLGKHLLLSIGDLLLKNGGSIVGYKEKIGVLDVPLVRFHSFNKKKNQVQLEFKNTSEFPDIRENQLPSFKECQRKVRDKFYRFNKFLINYGNDFTEKQIQVIEKFSQTVSKLINYPEVEYPNPQFKSWVQDFNQGSVQFEALIQEFPQLEEFL